MDWRKKLTDTFGMHRRERLGTFALLCICLLLLGARLTMRYWLPRPQLSFTGFNVSVDSLIAAEEERSLSKPKKTYTSKPSPKPRPEYAENRRAPLHHNLELNTADSAALVALPGIGPVLGGRIIKYRRLLGGYASPAQLMEVYGLSAENFLKASPFLYADTAVISKLDPNLAEFKTLSRHPYIGYEATKRIVRYREKQGRIDDRRTFGGVSQLPDSTLRKVYPYLLLTP